MGKVPMHDLEKYDWDDISQKLTGFASRRLGSRGSLRDAEEIAQEALTKFLDPEYADWDRQKQPDLLQHLGSIVNGILIDRVRKWRTERDYEKDYHHFLVLTRYGEALSPEKFAVLTDYVQRTYDLLFERTESDKIVEQILALELEDVHEAAEQAARLNLPIADIRNARRRLDAHRTAVDKILNTEATHADTEK